MCGIFGRVGQGDPYSLKHLALLSQSRGTDAAGFAWVQGGTVKFTKRQGSMLKLLKRLPRRALRSSAVIGHTRLATSGHPSDNVNNHPHVGRKWVIVHNGVITNAERFNRIGACDSEAILSALEKQPTQDAVKAIKGAVDKLTGFWACAAIHVPTGAVYVWCDSIGMVWTGKLAGAMVFASERQFLQSVYHDKVSEVRCLPTNTLIRLTSHGIANEWRLPARTYGYWVKGQDGKWHASAHGDSFQGWCDDDEWMGATYPKTKSFASSFHRVDLSGNVSGKRLPIDDRPSTLYTPASHGEVWSKFLAKARGDASLGKFDGVSSEQLRRGWDKLEAACDSDIDANDILRKTVGSPCAFRLQHGDVVLCYDCAAVGAGLWASESLVALYPYVDVGEEELCGACRMPLIDGSVRDDTTP